jgi:uncharacterized protein (DUF1778 family)
MHQKAEHLHIRATERDKAMLAQAAHLRNMSVSQFILRTSIPVAEEIVRSDADNVQTLFKLDADAWEAFTQLLDAPSREIPKLKELMASQAPWEK